MADEQQQLENKTRIRLVNLDRRKKSLIDIAADIISTNFRYYVNQNFKERQKSIVRLPGALHQKLLQSLSKQRSPCEYEGLGEFSKILEFFTLLLGPQIKEIEVSGMMTFCPASLRREELAIVVKKIAKKAPRIQILTLDKDSHSETELSFDLATLSQKSLLKSIGKLKMLKKLTIVNCGATYHNVKKLCKKLKNLVYLKLKIISFVDVEDDLKSFKKIFSRLKVWNFYGRPFEMCFQHFHPMCIQHLPNLQYFFDFSADRHFSTFFSQYQSPPMKLPEVTSNLRHICVNLSDFRQSQFEMFPHLTNITVFCAPGEHLNLEQELPAVPKIKCLVFECFPTAAIVARFIQFYRHNLRELKIQNLGARLDLALGDVLDTCPKLETLVLQFVNITDDEKPLKFFAELKQFEVLNWYRPLHLSHILAAPKLEKFVMRGTNYIAEDLRNVASLIVNQKILRRLRYFQNECHFVPWSVELAEAVIDVMENASAYVPNLTHCTFNFSLCHLKQQPLDESHKQLIIERVLNMQKVLDVYQKIKS